MKTIPAKTAPANVKTAMTAKNRPRKTPILCLPPFFAKKDLNFDILGYLN
jgi:hypothetical protein